MAEFRVFQSSNTLWEKFADGQGENLLNLAAEAVAIDQYKGRPKAENASLEDFINQAEMSLRETYQNVIVNTTKIFFTSDPRTREAQKAAEAQAREAEKAAEEKEKEEEKKAKKAWKRYVLRLKMALFGGFALIIPMIIMVLHPTQLTALLTTSIFVLAVAMTLAMTMDEAEAQDVVVATAAYTATLVVFVGAYGSNVQRTTGPRGHSLSGGAIAGIVVGCVVGIILLMLIFCCIVPVRVFDTLAYICGFRRSQVRRGRRSSVSTVIEDTVVETRRPRRRGFFGLGGRRTARRTSYDSDSSAESSLSRSDGEESMRSRRSRALQETTAVAANQNVG
jgi:hypothetical protein